MAKDSPGQRLFYWRKSRGLSQKQAGDMAGVSQPVWSEWEKGTRRPGRDRRVVVQSITDGAVPAAEWGDEDAAVAAGEG